MCGITGGIGSGVHNCIKENLSLLERRGPDHQGILDLEHGLTLGATRLAMTDPHARSNQPMIDSDSGNAIVFNGEVYNFKVIREKLASKGLRFNTESDTEVVLKAISYFGLSIISEFEGMFALAVYEKATNSLILARDYLGKKPLYYSLQNDKLFFASTVSLIKKFISGLQLSIKSIDTYLKLGYLVDPDTMYERVKAIKPGEIIVIDLISLSIKNRIDFVPTSLTKTPARDIRTSIDEAILARVDGHNRLAISLSGGVDSTILAMRSAMLGLDVSAYTLRWPDSDKARYNLDSENANKIGSFLGIPVNNINMPSTDKIPQILDVFVEAMDEPNSNPTGLSMMVLYSEIAKNGHNLTLTGDGADEVFGGYERYSLVNKFPSFWKSDTNLFNDRGILDFLHSSRIKKFSYPLIPSGSKSFWLFWHLIASSAQLNDIGWKQHDNDFSIYGEKLMSQLIGYKNSAASLMFRDLSTWLPMESNRKLDRTSMWYSIEARSPFQSENVIREGYYEMSKYKFSKVKKEILFDTFKELGNMPINKSKSGFISPLGHWLRNNPSLVESSIKNLTKRLSLNGNEMNKLIDAPNNKDWKNFKFLWSLIVLERWLTLNNH